MRNHSRDCSAQQGESIGMGDTAVAAWSSEGRLRLTSSTSTDVSWPAWASAIAISLFVLFASGCQSSEPVVPQEIYEQVNNDGREWTYDTAWQNIRMLKADLDSGALETLTDDALFIVSQMERLEKAKASAMRSAATAKFIEQVANEAATRSDHANVEAIKIAAQRLQNAFDAGDFGPAKEAALEVHTISQRLGHAN